jgi:Glycosyltransferases involved in cell wall biogenesis
VLPTYNERENVERMVRTLHGLGVQVLVIDDNSPDGTGAIADALAAELEGVAVLHRPHKEGLGPAYIAGFRRALAEGADLILEMDCDFSHDPADVPRLLSAAENADLVIASRYVEGGGTRNWNLLRRFISRGGRCTRRCCSDCPCAT